MYELTSNEHKFEIKPLNELGLGELNGENFEIDVKKINDKEYHIIKDSKTYTFEIVNADYANKSFSIKVNNTAYEFEGKDQFDLLLSKLGMDMTTSQKVKELKAPMPGLVLKTLVSSGDTVAKGDGLIVLEAMKMENVLKSPEDLVVKSIEVEIGKSVEKNQILIEFE